MATAPLLSCGLFHRQNFFGVIVLPAEVVQMLEEFRLLVLVLRGFAFGERFSGFLAKLVVAHFRTRETNSRYRHDTRRQIAPRSDSHQMPTVP